MRELDAIHYCFLNKNIPDGRRGGAEIVGMGGGGPGGGPL